MKAKEYLQQLKILDMKINQKKKQIDELHLLASNMGSLQTDNERVQTSSVSDMGNIIIKYIDLENEINMDLKYFADKQNEIINHIQSLNDSRYVKILFMRYVQYKKMKVIADELNYAYPYTRKLHGQALQDFERRYTMLH